MKFRFAAQTALEWVAIRLGLLPEPMAQAHLYTVLSRAILEANHAGLFAALESGPASVASLAQRLELNERALGTLATCLAAAGYLEHDGQALSLTPMSHKWLTRSSPNSLDDFLRLCLTDWEWISRMGSFLRTGQGVDFHEHYTAVQWRMYQRAMAVGMRRCAQELARRLPVRAGASAMLDIGGGHGLFSAELCRRHARLHSVVLDLPQAVEVAAPLLAAEQLGDRVVHQAGDARTADLGECRLDVVLCANLMHHLTPDQNQDLCRRVTRALTPGGCFCIVEFIRPPISRRGDQIAATLDLFFALSSSAGTWSLAELTAWQTQVGLSTSRVLRFLTMPGFAAVIGFKRQAD